ncbi:putative ABC transport system permease protein [Oryzisolibacter propanilivorax]|uniref:Putative ABC transport system permease protein n=1 Tax=Oryzisolibacter propanilivorax TaxID=1527607 RepID=A0A1G9RE56_9BURK|nr:FtsX-like permease family protein [Oryzisolibacter propanilivorax]SDM21526.1 putative ABC transport system permease protein [Oryzisolibacter propanilivorax]
MTEAARPRALPLAWRALRRDLRAGELRLLLVAVLLAVAALTSVGFFADRLQGALARDALQLLGGDVVVASDNATPAAFVRQAEDLGLRHASTLGFPTMARADDAHGGAARLVALKGVEPGYPLRGRLQVADAPGQPGRPTDAIPAPGEVWVDAALVAALGLAPGDALLLGDARLTIARIVTLEPDRGAGFANFAPRVLVNAQDLPSTGLVQPASRITWRFAVAGEPNAARRFADWAQAEAARPEVRGVRVESLDSGQPEMRQTLDRAQKFLNLVALLAALLAAVAVALAARSFAARHLDGAALLRVLGAPQRTIARAYALEFFAVGLIGSLLGVLLGWAVHHAFVLLLAGLVASDLPAATLAPAALGVGVGLALLAAFGLPPVLQLARVPALRVLRRDLAGPRPASLLVLAAGLAGFGALLLLLAGDAKLGAIAVGGFAGAALLFAALAWLAVRALARLVPETRAPRWLLLATRQLAARPVQAVVQVTSLALGLLALVLLVLLRTDLIASWQRATPASAPNRFVINILPEQAVDFRARLAAAGVAEYDWYPMFRGRLVAINGREVRLEDYADGRARRLVDREFNLSHTAQPPVHNRISAGAWRAGEAGAVSVEDGIAKTLGLRLGDTLRFDIGGILSEARITSLRHVDWGSMRANFFVLYPLAEMPDMPLTYLAAYRAPERWPPQPAPAPGTPPRAGAAGQGGAPGGGSAAFDNALVHDFPNITNVDLSATLAQVQGVLSQVIRAVEFLFVFTLAAGLAVLFAAIAGSREARARELAVMRALGASGQLLRQVQRAELAGVGLLAGLLASSVALAVGWLLARQVFDFEWNAPLWVPLAGALAGAALALAAGWWALREVLRRPVVQTLREASA